MIALINIRGSDDGQLREFELKFLQMTSIKLNRPHIQNNLQLGILLKVIHPDEVINPQAVELVVGDHKIQKQQFCLILEWPILLVF